MCDCRSIYVCICIFVLNLCVVTVSFVGWMVGAVGEGRKGGRGGGCGERGGDSKLMEVIELTANDGVFTRALAHLHG